MQSLPGNIRGAVLGLAGRCKGTIWEDDDEEEEEEKEEEVEEEEPVRFLSAAVCVCFGCESLGLAGALSQVFNRVSTSCRVYTNNHVCYILGVPFKLDS